MRKQIRRVVAGLAALTMVTSMATEVFAIRYDTAVAVDEMTDEGLCMTRIVDADEDHVTFAEGETDDKVVQRKIRIPWEQIANEATVGRIASLKFDITYKGLDALNGTDCGWLGGGIWAQLSKSDYDHEVNGGMWDIEPDAIDFETKEVIWADEQTVTVEASFSADNPIVAYSDLNIMDWTGDRKTGDITFTVSNFHIYDKDGAELDQLAPLVDWEPGFEYDSETRTVYWNNPDVPWADSFGSLGDNQSYICYGATVSDGERDCWWFGTDSVKRIDPNSNEAFVLSPRMCIPLEMNMDKIRREHDGEPINDWSMPAEGTIYFTPVREWGADELYTWKGIDYTGLTGLGQTDEDWWQGKLSPFIFDDDDSCIHVNIPSSDRAVGYIVEKEFADGTYWYETIYANDIDSDRRYFDWFGINKEDLDSKGNAVIRITAVDADGYMSVPSVTELDSKQKYPKLAESAEIDADGMITWDRLPSIPADNEIYEQNITEWGNAATYCITLQSQTDGEQYFVNVHTPYTQDTSNGRRNGVEASQIPVQLLFANLIENRGYEGLSEGKYDIFIEGNEGWEPEDGIYDYVYAPVISFDFKGLTHSEATVSGLSVEKIENGYYVNFGDMGTDVVGYLVKLTGNGYEVDDFTTEPEYWECSEYDLNALGDDAVISAAPVYSDFSVGEWTEAALRGEQNWDPGFYMDGDMLCWKNAVSIFTPDLTQNTYCPGYGYEVWATVGDSDEQIYLDWACADIIDGELQDPHINLPMALAKASAQGIDVSGDVKVFVRIFAEGDACYDTLAYDPYEYGFEGGQRSDIDAPEKIRFTKIDGHPAFEWDKANGAVGYVLHYVNEGNEYWTYNDSSDWTCGWVDWDELLFAEVYSIDEDFNISSPTYAYSEAVKQPWKADYYWDSEHKTLLWKTPKLPYPETVNGAYAAEAQLEAVLDNKVMHLIAVGYNISETDDYGRMTGYRDGYVNDVKLEILKAQMSRTTDLTGTHEYRMGYYSTILGDMCADDEPYISSYDSIEISFSGGGVSDIAAPEGVTVDYVAEENVALIFWDDVEDAAGYIVYTEYEDGSYRWDAAGDSVAVIEDAPSDPAKVIVWSVDSDYNYSANMAPVSDANMCNPEGRTYYKDAQGKLYMLVYPDGDQMDIGRFTEVNVTGLHSYDNEQWTWAEDYSTVSVKLTCTDCGKEAEFDASITEQIIEDADCENDGSKLILAAVTVDGKEYTDSKQLTISKTGHDYGEPVWLWSDDSTSASAVFTCSRCKDEKTVRATVTEKIVTAADIGKAGKKTVTATAEFDGKSYTVSKDVNIPALAVPSPKITKIEPGNGKMNVTWEAVKGATNYTIHYKTGNTEKKEVRTAEKTGALISGIANGEYEVWVTAKVNGKESTAKRVTRTTLKKYYVECTTTSGMIAGGINIKWNKYSGATKYRVVCIDKNNNVIGTKVTKELTLEWKGLRNNQEYGFYVQPCVNGVYPTFIRTDENDSKHIKWTIPVNAPMIKKLSLGNKKVWLYYEAVPRATKYYIYKVVGNKETRVGITTNTKFLVKNLENGKKTTFYVKALVDGKLTPNKRKATRTTRAGMKPRVTTGSNKATLKWSRYKDDNGTAAMYKVVLVNEKYKQIASRETTNLSFTWNGLTKGKKYGFYVVPYVNGEYIPFGLSHAEDKANVVMFTAT